MPKTRRLLLALGIAAIVARAAYLFRRPFWFDEIFTLWISRRSPAGIVGALRLDSGPPLFYFLEWPFVRAGEILGADGLARAVSFLAVAAHDPIATSCPDRILTKASCRRKSSCISRSCCTHHEP